MSHVGIRFGSHLPCQELEAAEFLTSWDTPTAGLGYVLEMRQKVGNCSKSRFSTVKSGFQQKTDHNQVLDPRPDFSWDMDLQGICIPSTSEALEFPGCRKNPNFREQNQVLPCSVRACVLFSFGLAVLPPFAAQRRGNGPFECARIPNKVAGYWLEYFRTMLSI